LTGSRSLLPIHIERRRGKGLRLPHRLDRLQAQIARREIAHELVNAVMPIGDGVMQRRVAVFAAVGLGEAFDVRHGGVIR